MRSGLEKLAAKFTAKSHHICLLFSFFKKYSSCPFFLSLAQGSVLQHYSVIVIGDCKEKVAPFGGLPERLIVLKMVYEEVGYCLSPS